MASLFAALAVLLTSSLAAATPPGRDPPHLLLVADFTTSQPGRVSLWIGSSSEVTAEAGFTGGSETQRAVLHVPAQGGRQSLSLRWDTPAEEALLRSLKVIDLTGATVAAAPLEALQSPGQLTPQPGSSPAVKLARKPGATTLECQFELTLPTPVPAELPKVEPPPSQSHTGVVIVLALGILLGLAGTCIVFRQAFVSTVVAWKAPRTTIPQRMLLLAAAVAPPLAWALLFLSAFSISGIGGVIGVGLDDSWPLILEHAAQQGWRWGREVVFTFGPLGYLYPPAGLGGFVVERSLYAWCHSGLAAYVAWRCGLNLPPVLRAAFWLWLILFPATDVLLCALVACVLLKPASSARLALVELVALVFACSIMALVKFTNFTAAAAVFSAYAIFAALQRRWLLAVLAPALYAVFQAVIWLMAGQFLGDALPYVTNSLQIATGFNTMSYPSSASLLAYGLGLVGILALLSLTVIWLAPGRRLLAAVSTALVAGCAFVSWKHGFIRADTHVLQFLWCAFPYACLLALLMPWGTASPISRGKGLFIQAIALLALALSVPATSLVEGGWRRSLPSVIASLQGTVATMASTLQGGVRLPRVQDTPPEAWAPRVLHGVSQHIGSASLDIVNFQQGYAFLNGLNYRARPIFQSYSSYTPRLQQLNLDHFLSPARPEYVLLQLETIDNRLVWLDDAPLMLDLATSWMPCFREKGFLLLQKQKSQSDTTTPQGSWKELASKEVYWGRSVKLPPAEKHALRALRIDVDRSLMGRAKRFLYQGSNAKLILRTADGASINRTFVPEMATHGVLLSPWIGNVDELLSWKTGSTSREVTSFELEPWEGREGEFRQKYRYTLLEWQGPIAGVAATPPSAAPLTPYPYLPAVPVKLEPALDVRLLNGLEACCARAPTRLEFALPADAAGLVGRFASECAPLGSEPEKVGIHVTVLDAEGKQIFRHDQYLLPQVHPSDAGERFLDLDFPPATGNSPRRLILESSTNMPRNRVLSWWGPLVLKGRAG